MNGACPAEKEELLSLFHGWPILHSCKHTAGHDGKHECVDCAARWS